MNGAGHVALTGEKMYVRNFCPQNLKGKQHLERPRSIRRIILKRDLKET
jgi:hypothetical protein